MRKTVAFSEPVNEIQEGRLRIICNGYAKKGNNSLKQIRWVFCDYYGIIFHISFFIKNINYGYSLELPHGGEVRRF